MIFKMKEGVGGHVHQEKPGADLIPLKAGDTVKTDVDLAAMFPDKFERAQGLPETAFVAGPVSEGPPKPKDQPPVKGKPSSTKSEEKSEKTSLGKDVTAKFPKAGEEDFKVFTKDRGYWVAESDDPTTPLNETKLKKDEVDAFIDKYLQD